MCGQYAQVIVIRLSFIIEYIHIFLSETSFKYAEIISNSSTQDDCFSRLP